MLTGTGWQEVYLNEEGKIENGSLEKENIFYESLSRQIQEEIKHFSTDNKGPMRGNHAKIVAGFLDARFIISDDIPTHLQAGFLLPGEEYRAILRFSNGSGKLTDDDSVGDLRGVTMRVITKQGGQDFLMTNAEPHHARDAREAMVAIMSGVEKDIIADKLPAHFPLEEEIAGLIGALPYLIKHLGLKTGWQVAQTLKKQMKRSVESLATETFWSRSPIAIGKVPDPKQSVAVKYRLKPAKPKHIAPVSQKDLGKELKELVDRQEVKYFFQVQRFINNTDTPVEDSTVHWPSAFETIAELIIPQHAAFNNKAVDDLVFSPWNIDLTSFLPIGSMNRSRKKVYQASVGLRKAAN